MLVPEGLTEDEVVAIIYRHAKHFAPAYRFGYHDVEDLEQHAVEVCLRNINAGKFVPRGATHIDRQFSAYVKILIRCQLHNYRRNHSCRYESPNSPANAIKYNLMHPLKIHSQGLTNSEIFSHEPATPDAVIDREEIIAKLRHGLTNYPNLLKDFVRYINGVKLPAKRLLILREKLSEILREETDN